MKNVVAKSWHLPVIGGRRYSAPPEFFFTDFPANENPINQGGIWDRGGTEGLDWHNPLTVSGRCVASVNADSDGNRYADPIAVLKPSFRVFSANQYAKAIVYKNGSYDPAPSKHEIELLLCGNISAHSATFYEIGWGTDPYLFVVRWNGGVSDYTPIYDPGVGSISVPQDGDELYAQIIDDIISVKLNGVLVSGFEAIDVSSFGTRWTGNPGVGFWPVDGATAGSLGWKLYQCGDLP